MNSCPSISRGRYEKYHRSIYYHLFSCKSKSIRLSILVYWVAHSAFSDHVDVGVVLNVQLTESFGFTAWMASMLAEDKGISIVEAIKRLYSSAMYKKLQDESTKYWHLGPVALYEEFLAEQ